MSKTVEALAKLLNRKAVQTNEDNVRAILQHLRDNVPEAFIDAQCEFAGLLADQYREHYRDIFVRGITAMLEEQT